jgi:hypothetical protein
MIGFRVLEVKPLPRGVWEVRELGMAKPRSIHKGRVYAVRAATALLRGALLERCEPGRVRIRDENGVIEAERCFGDGLPADWGPQL